MSLIGAIAGTFTGLVPGIHVNTLASIMLISYPTLESAISDFADPNWVPVLVSACIMSASVVHSFVDFVPSVFIGAPDPDDALSILPGHRLLMNGQGMLAVRSAAVGSAIGATFAILLAIPVQYLMLNGLADQLDTLTFSILLFTLCVMVINEKGIAHKIWAILLILLSGFLGIMCMHMNLPCSGILGDGTLLFPLLTGLFGMPALMSSISNAAIPKQTDTGIDPVGPLPGIKGVITGCLAGWYPGITATAGASLASVFTPENDPARFISLVASIGTVTTVFSIVTLSVSGSGRSGTVLVVKEIMDDNISGFCSEGFLLLLLSIAIATAIGYIITIKAGRLMSDVADRFDLRTLNKVVILFVTILILLLTGPFGIVILIISTVVGFIPVNIEMSRIPLTGCLIVPVLLMESSMLDLVLSIV
ncbi:MAG: tripartite tricarboxylate transporter permease [Candidatus Methanomethylophilaceae archaeon]|nr:tripartite tricarboxylate transporter permease [Candidatus Methanomethylophilaceae archaeon]